MKWHRSVFFSLLAPVWLATADDSAIRIVFLREGTTVSTERQTLVLGAVTPTNAPLTINGQPVTPWRTGGFVHMAPVSAGTNTLFFRSGTNELHLTFFVPAPARAATHDAIAVVRPLQPLGVYTGETVRLECLAPTGRAVFASVGERTVPLSATPADPSRWQGSVAFSGPAEAVPVLFYADAAGPTVHAAPITAHAEWPTLVSTGGLFEVRLRTGTGENSETAGFLTPGLRIQGAGFCGEHVRVWLANRLYYVDSRHLASASAANPPPRDLPIPDLAQGFGPHPPTNRAPSAVLVVLDPGHGGDSTGAIGPCGTPEKQVALAQARVVKQALEEAGFRVRLTRDADVNPDLYERARLAYTEKADAFIALHYNATPPTANPQSSRHLSTYYWNRIGEALAQAIHPHIARATEIPDGGVRQASFAVCRNPAVPSVLIELDFITAPEGEEAIQQAERQKRVAEAIRDGLRDWLKPAGEQDP